MLKGQTAVITLVLSWYFPHHIWGGQFPNDIGNYYSNLYSSAEHVALSVAANKSRSLQGALNFHRTFMNTDLPTYLQDALINSAGVFWKTSMWLADGKFRMYESHSCDDLQPPHLHFYRAQALQTLLPTLERQIPELYSKLQVKRDNESFPGDVVFVGNSNYTTPGLHGNCSCGRPKGEDFWWNHRVNLTGDQACWWCMAGGIFNSIAHPQKCAAPGCITTDRTDLTAADRVDNTFDFVLDVAMNSRWSEDGRKWAETMWPSVKLALSWLVRSSVKHGLPHDRLNTFDEHGVMGTVNAYNSFAYLWALAAGIELAKDAGDSEAAATATTALARGKEALMKMLWQPAGGFFTSFWCEEVCQYVNYSTVTDCRNTTGDFSESNYALQSSVLYGANWLWLLGIGDSLHSLNSSIASHLRAELAYNLNPSGGGLLYTTNRTTGVHCDTQNGDGRFTDHDLWAMANPTHTSAALWTRAHAAVVEDAMKPTEAMIRLYSQTLNDQWDYHDVAWTSGPRVNSHYARQLNMWAIPLALSGQQLDARDPLGATLSFNRREPSKLRRWPVLTPLMTGIASDTDEGCAGGLSLEVLSGGLTLRELWLDGELLATNVTVGVSSSSAASSQFCSSRPEGLAAGSAY